ncbi:MAG: hypothetical protein NWQ54_14405 [Paraglaciecola sp.]|nr:hypothetical protein [Paraglaciecola sp.]
MKRRMLHSSVFRVAEAIISAVVMLVVTPMIIKTLGADSYGLWLLLLSGMGLLSFFEFGFASAVQRQMAQQIEQQDNDGLNQLFSSALFLFFLLGLFALVFLMLFALYPSMLGIKGTYEKTATLAFLLFILKLLFDFVANAIHGIFSGHLRFDLDSKIAILALTLKALLVIVVVEPYGILGLVIVTLFVDVSAQLAKFFFAFLIQPSLRLIWPKHFKQNCHQLFGYAKHVIFIELARLVQDKSSVILISHLLGLAAISLYAIADRLLKQAITLIQAITAVLQPYLVRKLVQGQLDIRLMQSAMQLHAWLSCIVLVPVMLCGPAFIQLWVGPDFALSQTLLVILVFAALFSILALPITQFLLAKAKHQWIAPLELIAAAFYVLVVLFLGRFYGLSGIVWGSVVVSFVINTIGYAFLARKELEISMTFYWLLVIRLWLIFSITYAVNSYLVLFTADMNWITLPLWALSSVVFSMVVGFFVLLDSSLRGVIYQRLSDLKANYDLNKR